MPPEEKTPSNPPEPEQAQTPSAPAPEPSASQAPPSLRQIRTFQGDVASALATQKESLFSIQQREKLKQASGLSVPADTAARPKRSREFTIFLVGGLFLLALAGAGGFYTYTEFVRRSAPPVVIAPSGRFISAESEREIAALSLSRESLFSAVSGESAGISEGELRHLILKEGASSTSPALSAESFFSIIESRAPGSLTRSFEDEFMLGSLGQSRFLIIKISSFENAFAGMLSWEKDMAGDLSPMFAESEILKNTGPASVFKDTIYRNKDARALFSSNAEGEERPALLYSFFGTEMLIITDRLETLNTLVERLTRERLER